MENVLSTLKRRYYGLVDTYKKNFISFNYCVCDGGNFLATKYDVGNLFNRHVEYE